jgi:hypothetical protein
VTTINQELYEALIAAGAPDDAAKRAAASIYDKARVATKVDIAELKSEVASIDGKLTILVALNLALVLAAVAPYVARLFT